MYAGSADQTTDTTKRDIFENFRTYSLEKPELIRMDNHMLDRHIRLLSDRSSKGQLKRALSDAMDVDATGGRGADAASPQSSSSSSSSGSSNSSTNSRHNNGTDTILSFAVLQSQCY